MTYFQPISIRRVEDNALLGRIQQRRDQVVAERAGILGAIQMPHISMDAAVHWVQSNPHVPEGCPHVHGMFGPELARWDTHRIIGCIHAEPSDTENDEDLGIGEHLDQTVLLALDARDRIQARLTQTNSGWTIVLAHGAQMLRNHRRSWAHALDMFTAQVLNHLVRGSMHQQMHVRQDHPRFKDAAQRFHDARATLRKEVPTGTAPLIRIQDADVRREEDGFVMGSIRYVEGQIIAQRRDLETLRDAAPHDSFDAALRWIRANPWAPDLDRFSHDHLGYGVLLWQRDKIQIVGRLVSPHAGAHEEPVLDALHVNRGKIAIVGRAHPSGEFFWSKGYASPQHNRSVKACTDQLCAAVVDSLPRYPATSHKARREVEAEMRSIRPRIDAFLHDRQQLKEALLAGPAALPPAP